MSALNWSFVLMLSGALVMYLAGRKSYWGWVLGVANQILWGWFSFQTHQYGFIIGCVLYGSVYSLNLWKWKLRDMLTSARARA